jgi:hypothetical protein
MKPLYIPSLVKHRESVLGWLPLRPSTQQGSVTIFGYFSQVVSQCWESDGHQADDLMNHRGALQTLPQLS